MSTIEYQQRSGHEISSAVRAGLIGGVSMGNYHASQRALSLSAEQGARRDEIVRSAARDRRARRAAGRLARRNSQARGEGSVSRWATWLPSVPRRRSSAAAPSSTACADC